MLFSLLSCLIGLFSSAFAQTYTAQNQLQQVNMSSSYPNPNDVLMYVYLPTKLASPLPLIVAMHYCGGTADIYFTTTQYAVLADTYGYVVIYPQAPRDGTCFDVSTNATLTHNGGGDSQGIASMITYAIDTYGVDSDKVYLTGQSSGAMMTNVMAGSYPELFQAGSAYSGVAFGCFADPDSDVYEWDWVCAEGLMNETVAEWVATVEAAYPGYTGSYPRMMLWHGTADEWIYYENLSQEIEQWTGIWGLSETPVYTGINDPISNYTMWIYGSPTAEVVAYSAGGVGHPVPVNETVELAWYGIAGENVWNNAGSGSPTSTTSSKSTTTSTTTKTSGTVSTTTTTTTTSSTTTSGSCVAIYGQCGGTGYTGSTSCCSGTCTYENDYYYQCV